MRRSDAISGIALLALALAMLFEASKLPFGRLSSPRPGFFPLILAVILAVFSLILLRQAVKEREERDGPFTTGPGTWKKIGLATGALLAFALLFESLGYILSVFLFMAFLLRAVEGQKWWLVFVVALPASLLSYLLFGMLLKTPLPAGILGI